MIINFFGIFFSFLLCGIPFGYLIFKYIKHDDIRKFGSHNIGATNVGRLLGKKYAVITFLLDGFKGAISILACKYLFNASEIYLYIVFMFCILGHIFSPYLKFKGGKGFATTLLAMYVMNWRIGLIMSIVWIMCFKITKISALSTLFSVCVMVVSSFYFNNLIISFILLLIAIILFVAHRENIKRLMNNNELGFKNK